MRMTSSLNKRKPPNFKDSMHFTAHTQMKSINYLQKVEGLLTNRRQTTTAESISAGSSSACFSFGTRPGVLTNMTGARSRRTAPR